ncbi:MAG: hypothetical protein VX335_00620, partial [Pseudomonadota bacterium]|nr:hypothetical protein [Pseudomonadota bacterium]
MGELARSVYHKDFMEYLISVGADIFAKNNRGLTPKYYADINQNAEFQNLLLKTHEKYLQSRRQNLVENSLLNNKRQRDSDIDNEEKSSKKDNASPRLT